jgi:hypothetical protein
MMKTIYLIACSRRKLKHRAKAEDLYVGDLFQKSLAYARKMKAGAVFILSAKYKLVQPRKRIDPYDLTLKKMSLPDVKAWSDIVFRQLKSRTDVRKDHFVILAGERYRRFLVETLPANSFDVPMEGLGIGKQLQFLKRHLA